MEMRVNGLIIDIRARGNSNNKRGVSPFFIFPCIGAIPKLIHSTMRKVDRKSPRYFTYPAANYQNKFC